MRELIVGTRKSKLALIQTNRVIDMIKKAGIPNPIKIKEIETRGDKVLSLPLTKLGGNAFLQEIETQLIVREIDFAVHSLKDVPLQLPPGLMIASIPEREDFRDAFLANHHVKLRDLPSGAVIGTSSLRRSAQLLAQRPDLQVKWIRGSIDSRIEQLNNGDFDAIILAVAGIKRLGLAEDLITEYLSPESFMPAFGQGALAIECRTDDQELHDIFRQITDLESERAVFTERLFLNQFDDGEKAAIGGYALIEADEIILHSTILSFDGKKTIDYRGAGKDPQKLAQSVANQLKKQGALDLIQSTRAELNR
ncbi:hydroxymethylbilane synthase [Amphibacillus sp. MSJ-3]|uniref:hydroxymethylbilane synthase n=1 Tax=Amphibacillus sp. MSJ-3 TaxID=2841505 RepID=UPI001C0F2042|nr:hydroxymethylbilane synthase [Amphibacillus sp. MSJ-3]MBU5595302.1 hydroxymethylbilane synthase [Amphibacillus sp. MSJ-3]